MFGDEKNLKDTASTQSLMVKDIRYPISYTKTNKLISALFMVTDIMDKEEPLRSKLRTLGVEIISDINSNLAQAEGRVYEIISLLDIAFNINLISEMNRNILKKEFLELDQSIKTYKNPGGKPMSLQDFLQEPEPEKSAPTFSVYESQPIGQGFNKQIGTRIGVQKGGTLLKALSDRTNVLDFNIIKKQRRDDIASILKANTEGATITMIMTAVKDKKMSSLLASGEKTLQRELVSMVKDGLLKKTGEKRWSRYFLAK